MADVIKSLSIFSIIGDTAYALFGTRPLPIIGFDKLYTEVIKYFVTQEGSDIFDRSYGTPLLNLIGSGGDPIYVEEVIDDSLIKTRSYFFDKADSLALAGTPLSDSEALLAFELIGYETLVDILNISVRISNKEGETKAINLILE